MPKKRDEFNHRQLTNEVGSPNADAVYHLMQSEYKLPTNAKAVVSQGQLEALRADPDPEHNAGVIQQIAEWSAGQGS